MTPLTPPSSSHRSDKDKENKYSIPLAGPSTRSVVWASEETIHCLSTPPKHTTISSKQRPSATKSILKKTSQNRLFSVPADTKEREITPEPSDPLVNLHYLDHPVAQIISSTDSDGGESLSELIEGYNVLAARLRASVADSTDADASWPLFQPLRKNSQALLDAISRDLGRALVDPMSATTVDEELTKFSLPSPQCSPTKKKGGMSAEQVKYARDLCTTCHSVIKLLSAIFSFPVIYTVFQEKQLRQILTAVLAIPLADNLPTPNARKTCALAIWLIQVQRLPADVLQPAADRIAYALRRGMDGELGKEGKKGSASDGLKAIHDLCLHLPGVFIPAFTPLLPSILSNLLASTLALRMQACHALGGFVIGVTSTPVSTVHTKIASAVASYLTTLPEPSPSKKSPTKPTEAAIVRTLRTTMGAVDPGHVAQGPVWGISVLASFVVLLGSRLCADTKVNRIISSLLSLGMRNQKSSVRALCCLAWRTVTWAYFQPPLPVESDEESEVDDDERAKFKHARQAHCKVMLSVVDCQAGIATIAAFLGDESSAGDEPLRRSIEILQAMTSKAGQSCMDAIDAMRHMVSFSHTEQDDAETWDPSLLLPKGLFSANPGLLTTEFKNLTQAVRPLFDNTAMISDIRCLTREEMAKKWVFMGMLVAWRTAIGCLELGDDAEVPENLSEVWASLLKANVGYLQDNEDDAGTATFASLTVRYLVEIVENPQLNFMPKKLPPRPDAVPDSDETVPEIDGATNCTNGELRLRVVRSLWTSMKTIFPHASLGDSGEVFLACLMRNDHSLLAESARLTGNETSEEDEGEQPRNAWVSLYVEILDVCDPDAMKVFWGCEEDAPVRREKGTWGWNWTKEFTNAVWKTSVEKWRDGEGHWEGGVILLGVPFTDRHTWILSGDDYTLWEDMLSYTTSKALDHGVDASTVLDSIASLVSSFQTPGAAPDTSTRLVDLLLSHLDAPDMRDIPLSLLELASETMRATYPPEPRNKAVMMWLARSLMTVIENCPAELCLRLLQSVQEGLCLWLGDECQVWTENDVTYDIIPLYQHILVRIQALPETVATLEAIGSILASVFRNRVPKLAVEAFTDFWKLAYAQLPTPAEGWPEPIRHSLRSVGLRSAEEADNTSSSTTTRPTTPLAAAFALPASSPRTPIASSFSTPTTAIIKREALSQIPSPQRPHKIFGTFPIVPSSPVSPLRRRTSSSSSSSSVRRTPLSAIQLCGSPTKRRRLMKEEDEEEEKENLSSGKLVSVAERIAEILKSTPNDKKRRLEDDEDESKSPTSPAKRLKSRMKAKTKPVSKKGRIPSPAASAASSNESEDERWVESALKHAVPFPSTEDAEEQQGVFTSGSVSMPRRSRVGRTAPSMAEPPVVELLQKPQARDHHISSLDGEHKETPIRKIDLRTIPLRRCVSIPESMLTATVPPRKRKRKDSNVDTSGADRLPALQVVPPRQFKQSYSLPLSDDSDTTVVPASSDDDLHLGQVTPHHLISPILQRRGFLASKTTMTPSASRMVMEELFGDDDVPGSDDSVAMPSSGSESDSPTKECVARQLQRMGSESRFFKSPGAVSS